MKKILLILAILIISIFGFIFAKNNFNIGGPKGGPPNPDYVFYLMYYKKIIEEVKKNNYL